MPTVSKIAEFIGVSKSTVSLALNNKPGVSADMRRHVLRAMEALRLQEDAVDGVLGLPAVSERQYERKAVAIFHPPILESSQVFRELLMGIQAGADLLNLHLRLTINDPAALPTHVSRLYLEEPGLRPDGVLIIGARQVEPILDRIGALGIPCVLVARDVCEPGISAVGYAERSAALEVTNHLVALGHRAIAFLGGDLAYRYTGERLAGYQAALAAQEIAAPERWIVPGNGAAAARRLVAECPDVTAVVCVNDAHAVAALPIFGEAGWRVPERLSIVSFDDTDEVRECSPALTSICYPRYQVGLWSVRVLAEQLRDAQLQSVHMLFRSRLVVRASSAALHA